MTAKTDYDFVLWGVPRFHRTTKSQATPLQPAQQPGWTAETAAAPPAPSEQTAAALPERGSLKAKVFYH